MDNSSYRDLYISQHIESRSLSDQAEDNFINFWKRVSSFEANNKKRIEDGYSKDDFLRLLSALNSASITCFRPHKSIIRKYIEFLIDKGVLTEESVDILSSITYDDIDSSRLFELKFFKDFSSLQNTIDTTLTDADKVDDRIFATQITAIYMAWCGLTIKEALALKKADVEDDCIHVGDRIIYPNPTIMKYVKEYRDAMEYHSAAKGIITLKYVPSEWLFRTVRSEHIDSPKTMRIFIYNFGKGDSEVNMFNYDKVYWSGVYHRAYMYELENGLIASSDLPTINKIFGENLQTSSQASIRLRSYRKFVQYFFLSR